MLPPLLLLHSFLTTVLFLCLILSYFLHYSPILIFISAAIIPVSYYYPPFFLPSVWPYSLTDLLLPFSLSFFFPSYLLPHILFPAYSPFSYYSSFLTSLLLPSSLLFSLPSLLPSPPHHCIHTHNTTVIGTLYCAKGNFEFGISRIIKVTLLILFSFLECNPSYPFLHYTPWFFRLTSV